MWSLLIDEPIRILSEGISFRQIGRQPLGSFSEAEQRFLYVFLARCVGQLVSWSAGRCSANVGLRVWTEMFAAAALREDETSSACLLVIITLILVDRRLIFFVHVVII